MTNTLRIALVCLVITATGAIALGIWGAFGLSRAGYTALEKWGNAAPAKDSTTALLSQATNALGPKGAVGKLSDAAVGALNQYSAVPAVVNAAVNKTADNINRPCKGPAGPDACGTLAQVNKTLVKAGDEVVTTQTEQQAVFPHITNAMDALKGAAVNFGTDANSINDIITGTSMTTALTNFSGMMASGKSAMSNLDGVTDSLDKMGKHLEKKVDTPESTKQKILDWVPWTLRTGGAAACLVTGTCG